MEGKMVSHGSNKIKGIVPEMRRQLAELKRHHRQIELVFSENINRQAAKEFNINLRVISNPKKLKK
jgi:hypothetical protein